MEKQVSGEEYSRISSRSVKKSRNLNLPILAVVVAIIIGALGFYLGIQYQKGHQGASNASSAFRTRNGSFRRGLRVVGTVSAISPTSITVNNQFSGSAVTLNITASTQITDNGQAVTTSDIQSGTTVLVTKDSSNTSNATSIIVNPSIGGFGGSGTPESGATPN